MLTLFTISSDMLASTTAYVGSLVTDAGPFIWLFIGVPLGFVVVKRLISMMPKEEKTKKSIGRYFWPELFEKEEKEFKKVSGYIEKKESKKLGKWLEGWRKGKIKF